jgi:hypothetical protein
MKFTRPLQLGLLSLGLGLVLAGGGCSNPFIPKYKVLVDAIASPEAQKPQGQSFRLVAKPSVVNQTPVQVPVIAACVSAALTGAGMFEAPPNVPSDIVIELSYGTESSPRVESVARETFLQLSARTNPEQSLDRATGPEVWDVRVAVLGLSPGSPVESAMPLLSSVAVGYLATDTHLETQVDIPHNSPTIAAVRDNAIKTLEAKYPANVNAAKASTQAPQIPAVLPPPMK